MSLRDGCGDDEVYCGKLRASENLEEDGQCSNTEPNAFANWDLSQCLLDFENLEGRSDITSYQEFDNTLEQVEYIFKYTPKTDKNIKVNCKDAETKLDTEMVIGHQNSLQTIVASEHLEEDTEPNITSKHNYIKYPELTSRAVSITTLSPEEPNLFANGDVSNGSLNLEEMVEEFCDNSFPELDNTHDEIEYILKNAPELVKKCKAKQLDTEMRRSQQNVRQTIAASEHLEEDTEPDITLKHNYIKSPEVTVSKKAVSNTTLSPDDPNLFANRDVSNSFLNLGKMTGKSCDTSSEELDNTLEETKKLDTEMGKMSAQGNRGKLALNLKPAIVTTMKKEQKEKEIFGTSSSVLQSKPSIYKTVLKSPVFQKPSTSSLKKTPTKNLAFEHVASPVAYYINSSPRIPLIRTVHPKETLLGLPSSPELVKTTGFKPSNKEYVNLPNVAYKSAKESRVIDVSNAPKMPQSQWAKELTKSLPRPAVIKHTHREKFINKHSETTNREPEDSFGDLSMHQADISVCTKKTF